MLVNKLIGVLSDGEWHSGESLGSQLGVTRAAIWKQIQVLMGRGLPIERAKASGYRLLGGLSLLDCKKISSLVSNELVASGGTTKADFSISCVDIIESTNAQLMSRLSQGQSVHAQAVLAESQTAGRGRRSREWHSPYAQNLYFSLGWHFSGGIGDMQGLSLAVSVAIADAIASLYEVRVDLKWPNDIFYNQKKLGGILLEIGGDLSDQCAVVIGLGLNINMLHAPAAVDQPWVGLRDILASLKALDRNALAAQVYINLYRLLSTYSKKGFSSYRHKWESYCPHIDQPIDLHSGNDIKSGVMVGVTDFGELVLRQQINNKVQELLVHGGEVSLRAK